MVRVKGEEICVSFRIAPPATATGAENAGAWHALIDGRWNRLSEAPGVRADGDPPWPVILEPHVRTALLELHRVP